MIQSFFQQDGPHLHEHFRADRLLVCPIFCLSQHLKGVHVRLPELVIQKALDAEALHSQGVQEILIPYSVLEPEQILISAQQSYRADKRIADVPPRRVERQPVGEAVADQWLGKIIQAGQINAILTSFDDIHVIEQQHPLRWVCLHAQC